MTRYVFNVQVDAESPEHAVRVMCERTDYDEQYEDRHGNKFDYGISWSVPLGDQYDELMQACDIFYEEEVT